MPEGRLVMIPFLTTNEDGSEDRNWARLRFYGAVNRRRIKREVRKWIKRTLGRSVHPYELRRILKYSSHPLYEENNS